MHIEFDQLSPNQRYHLLTQTVIPRPIAWVLSENEDKTLNLAPFSFFNALCSDPPILVLSIGNKVADTPKDTAVNLLSGRPFVVHIANVGQAEVLTATAADLAYGESEVEASQLGLTEFEGAGTHRLADCDIAYHCRLYDHHTLGPNKQSIIYVEIINLYLSEGVAESVAKRVKVDAGKVNPLSRLGAAEYAAIGPSFSIKRPK